jgi:transposase
MPKTRPPYPTEFREEAVRLARSSGKRTSEIPADLGISYESLRKWLKQHEVDGGNVPGVTSNERDELRRLRRENRILKEERDILRKAAAYFARETR